MEGVRRVDIVKDTVGILQGVLTIIAVIVAALWFFVQREPFHRVNIIQSIEHRKINKDLNLMIVFVKIDNIGKRYVTLDNGTVRVQVIFPFDDVLNNLINGGKSILKQGEPRPEWPFLNEIDLPNLNRRLEPGETDKIDYHFTVPSHIKTVRVYSHFTTKNSEIGWTDVSVYDFK